MSTAQSIEKVSTVGITRLDPAVEQPGIERLGPPPGNQGILVRGGLGWLFGFPVQPEVSDPRIIREPPPDFDTLAAAMAREMARRWSYSCGLDGRRVLKAEAEGSVTTKVTGAYAEIESSFVTQMVAGFPSMTVHGGVTSAAQTTTGTCSCGNGGTCGSSVCSPWVR